MSKILALFESVLREDGVTFEKAPELGGLRLGFTGEHGNWPCFAKADDERAIASFFSIAPFVVEAAQRDEVMRYLTRASFGLPLGAFELDLDEGEVRFKTAVALMGVTLDVRLVQNLIWSNVATMDRYLPGLVAVTQGLAAEKALSVIEG